MSFIDILTFHKFNIDKRGESTIPSNHKKIHQLFKKKKQ